VDTGSSGLALCLFGGDVWRAPSNSRDDALAKTLNETRRQRVILWSQEELEPYDVYERSKGRLGQLMFGTTLLGSGREFKSRLVRQ
jgi:hypothetical protein